MPNDAGLTGWNMSFARKVTRCRLWAWEPFRVRRAHQSWLGSMREAPWTKDVCAASILQQRKRSLARPTVAYFDETGNAF